MQPIYTLSNPATKTYEITGISKSNNFTIKEYEHIIDKIPFLCTVNKTDDRYFDMPDDVDYYQFPMHYFNYQQHSIIDAIPESVSFDNVGDYFIMEVTDLRVKTFIINEAFKHGYDLIPNNNLYVIEMRKSISTLL